MTIKQMIFQRSVFAFMPLSLLMLRLYRVSFFYTPLCRATVSIGRACIISALKLSGNSVCDWQRWHHRSCHPVQMVCLLGNIFFPFWQDLIELHLTYCNNLSARSLRALTSFRHTLVSLSLFGCTNIFYRRGGAPLACAEEDDDDEEDERPARFALDNNFNFQVRERAFVSIILGNGCPI